MQKNKFISMFLFLIIAFSTFFSFSSSVSASTISASGYIIDGQVITPEEISERLQKLQTHNPLEMAISGVCLDFGDFLLDYMVFLFKDEITVDRLVFNQVTSLNANFFALTKKNLVPDATEAICDLINDWYDFFRGLAIVAYLIVLVLVGIKIILGMPGSKAKAQDLIIKWTIGIALLYLFPFVMKYSFELNDAIITEIRATFNKNNFYDEIVGSFVGNISDIQYDQVFEERSPEYISRSDYVYTIGSEEATFAYIRELEKYQRRGDVMRIMRALAGVTGKFIYVFLWFIMLWQVLVLVFVYTKRFLMIAFLMMIFPLVVIVELVGAVKTGKSGAFSAWCMEFFLNVFIQLIHAIIYGIIGGVVMAHVQNGIVNGNVSRINWVILVIAINFIFEGEAIIKKIIKANAKSIGDAADVSKGMKNIRKNITKKLKID